MSKPYHALVLWKEAHQYVLEIYKATNDFPKTEQFLLTNQLRRAATSVPTNIVEGQARATSPDRARFTVMATASLEETEYLLELARDLDYLTGEQYNMLDKQRGAVSYLLHRFSSKLTPSS